MATALTTFRAVFLLIYYKVVTSLARSRPKQTWYLWALSISVCASESCHFKSPVDTLLLQTLSALTHTQLFLPLVWRFHKRKMREILPPEAAKIWCFVWSSAEPFVMLVIVTLGELDEFWRKTYLLLQVSWQGSALAVPHHIHTPPFVWVTHFHHQIPVDPQPCRSLLPPCILPQTEEHLITWSCHCSKWLL